MGVAGVRALARSLVGSDASGAASAVVSGASAVGAGVTPAVVHSQHFPSEAAQALDLSAKPSTAARQGLGFEPLPSVGSATRLGLGINTPPRSARSVSQQQQVSNARNNGSTSRSRSSPVRSPSPIRNELPRDAVRLHAAPRGGVGITYAPHGAWVPHKVAEVPGKASRQTHVRGDHEARHRGAHASASTARRNQAAAVAYRSPANLERSHARDARRKKVVHSKKRTTRRAPPEPRVAAVARNKRVTQRKFAADAIAAANRRLR